MRRSSVVVVSLAMSLVAGQALACGESLYRLGRGVTFREYSAPLPGNLLVVAKTAPERAMAERLAAAGHDVHVVSDPSEIGAALLDADHDFEVVLAFYNQRNEVEAQTAATAAVFIPVVLDDAEREGAASRYGRYLLDQDSVKRFLRTIHSVLREHA